MATCNGERFVAEQVESLLEGTRVPDEIVVVDDASTDGTIAATERALRAAPATTSVRVERNRANEGAPLAFARGVRLSTGDAVLFCDQDDRWFPHARRQGRAFYEERVAFALGVASGYGTAASPAMRTALEALLAVSRDRRELGDRPRWARVVPAGRLWTSGFYGRHYNGFLTFARDVFL